MILDPELGYAKWRSKIRSCPLQQMPKSTHTADYKVLLGLLRELRDQKGMLQSELAQRLKVPQSFISKSENGERRVDVLEVRKWCVALGVPFVVFAKELDKRLSKRR